MNFMSFINLNEVAKKINKADKNTKGCNFI